MVATVNLKPKVTRQIPRNVPLYRKADWVSFKTFMSEAASDILSNFQDKNVEEIWSAFKSYIHSGIKKFIPVKKIGSKRSLPWVTQEIKRLIRKGQIIPLTEVRQYQEKTTLQKCKVPCPK